MTYDFLEEETDRLRADGMHRRMRVFDGPPRPRTMLEGREVILLASNAYLGLNTHPSLVQAADAAAKEYGTGSGGSRLISGSTRLHGELETAIAQLKGTEDAVLFGTGYQANVGTITALVGRGDLVLSDELNHASIIDGCQQSRAEVLVYRHADAAHAEALLREHRERGRRCLIVTDGVFSMDGDLAPIRALCDVAEKQDSMMMVDDAHGTGVLGPTGAGSVELTRQTNRVRVQMGTLSKALASEGGFVAGSRTLCDFVRNRSRAFVFSTAPAPPSVAAALAALRIVGTEPERRERLQENATLDFTSRPQAGAQSEGGILAVGVVPVVRTGFPLSNPDPGFGLSAPPLPLADEVLVRVECAVRFCGHIGARLLDLRKLHFFAV